MTVVSPQAVLDPPVQADWGRGDLLAATAVAQTGQTATSDQRASTREAAFENLGYRIGRFLGATAQGRRGTRPERSVSLTKQATPEAPAFPSPAGDQPPTNQTNTVQPGLRSNGHTGTARLDKSSAMPLVATGGGLGVLIGLPISITAVLELLKGRT